MKEVWHEKQSYIQSYIVDRHAGGDVRRGLGAGRNNERPYSRRAVRQAGQDRRMLSAVGRADGLLDPGRRFLPYQARRQGSRPDIARQGLWVGSRSGWKNPG